MRILIDAITPGASLDPRAGGMRTYLTALTKTMSELEPKVEFVVLESQHFPLAELQGISNITRLECPGVPTSRVGRIIYQNTVLPVYLRTLKGDAFLATCNVLPFGCPIPAVVVVQSLQFFDHREAYGTLRGMYLRAAVRHASHHAKSLICVSISASRELARLTDGCARVDVVHHGVSPVISNYKGTVEPVSPPYILCVATLYRYKNVERLVRAFAMFKRDSSTPHRLRIIGGEADLTFAEVTRVARQVGVEDQIDVLGPMAHSQLPSEYAHASVFVYPSLAETFGHPPLEAMTIGVPVVASNAGPIPEIVGDAAELIDPLDVKDIARGLARVVLDSARSRDLVLKGIRRAREFNWNTSAQQTFAALQSALAQVR